MKLSASLVVGLGLLLTLGLSGPGCRKAEPEEKDEPSAKERDDKDRSGRKKGERKKGGKQEDEERDGADRPLHPRPRPQVKAIPEVPPWFQDVTEEVGLN